MSQARHNISEAAGGNTSSGAPDTPEPAMQVVYDGECPFCSRYVRMIRLKDVVGDIELIDARNKDHPLVRHLREQGYDLDDGMAVAYQGAIHHGADALNMLTVLSTRSHAFNSLMKLFFTVPGMARFFYPAMRLGRNIALRLKGSSKLARYYAGDE